MTPGSTAPDESLTTRASFLGLGDSERGLIEAHVALRSRFDQRGSDAFDRFCSVMNSRLDAQEYACLVGIRPEGQPLPLTGAGGRRVKKWSNTGGHANPIGGLSEKAKGSPRWFRNEPVAYFVIVVCFGF